MNNAYIQKGLGTFEEPDPTDSPEKARTKLTDIATKTEAKLVQMAASVLSLPVTAIPVGLGALLLTGNPVSLAAIGITTAAIGGGYLIYEGGKIVLRQTEAGEKIINIAKKPFGMLGGLVVGISRLADPNDKGLLTRFLNFVEKRGEGDVPKELKNLLGAYSVLVKGVTFPVTAAVNVFGYTSVALGLLYNGFKDQRVKNKAAKEAENAAEAAQAEEDSKKIENELLAYENAAVNFEQNLDLILLEEKSPELTQIQKDLFKKKEIELIPIVPDPAIEAINVEYRGILGEENLYSRFDIDLNVAENPANWNTAIQLRKMVNGFLQDLPGATPPVMDGTQNSLVNFYNFLNGQDNLSPEQLTALDGIISTYFGGLGFNTLADLNTNPTFVDWLCKELLLIYKKSIRSANPKDYSAQMGDLNKMVDMMEIHVNNPQFLALYKDTWLAGGAVNIGGRDRLEPQNTEDLVSFHRWVTIPDAPIVDTEITRINTLRTNLVPANLADFETKMTALLSLNQIDAESALEDIVRLNPVQTETFVNISTEIQTNLAVNPNLKDELEKSFQIFYIGAPAALDETRLEQVILTSPFSPELKATLTFLKPFLKDQIFLNIVFNYITAPVSLVEIFLKTSPYFESLYEYYGGNITQLYNDGSKYLTVPPNFQPFMQRVDDRLNTMVFELNKLKTILLTPGGKDTIRTNRNDYFEKVIRGEVLINENLADGRDHLKYLEELSNQLVTLTLIPNPADVLALVPDINYYSGTPILLADLDPTNPLIVKLTDLSQQLFNDYINGDDTRKGEVADTIQILNMLGFSGKLTTVNPPVVAVEYNPRSLVKYLNGVKIGQSDVNIDSIFARHPFGYEA